MDPEGVHQQKRFYYQILLFMNTCFPHKKKTTDCDEIYEVCHRTRIWDQA